MAFERKEVKESKTSESSVIETYITNPENIANGFAQRSMGMAILKLRARYLKDEIEKDEAKKNEAKKDEAKKDKTGDKAEPEKTEQEKKIETMCAAAVADLKKISASLEDNELKAGIDHILEKIKEPIHTTYDCVKLYVPIAGTNPVKYKEEDYLFPLNEVLALSWTALNDDAQYAHLPVDPKDEKPIEHRRRSMLLAFALLKKETPCHLGHRHQILFPLHRSAKDVDVIPDEKTTILEHLKQHIYPLFWKKWFSADAETKKQLFAALCQWMKHKNLAALMTLVDPNKTILSSLKEKFIQHGSSPDSTEKEYELALKYTDFEAHKDHPTMHHLHQLLAAEEIDELDFYNQAIEQIKLWIETQFDFSKMQHHEWIRKFYKMQQAQFLLNRYDLLLILTAKKEQFSALAKSVQEYFTHFKIESFPDVSDETLDQIIKLEDAVISSKKSTLSGEVESFFANWYDPENRRDSAALNQYYGILIDGEFQRKVELTDETIAVMIKNAIAEGEKESKDDKENEDDKESKATKLGVEPYQINRLFLHAIIVHPEEWTECFTHHLVIALNFVKNGCNKDYLKEKKQWKADDLKKYSYPDSLIKQLEYLIKVHRQEPADRPANMILLPQHAKSLQEWLTIFKYMNAKSCASYAMPIHRAFMNEENVSPQDFRAVIRTVPRLIKGLMPKVFNMLKLQRLSLSDILEQIPEVERIAFWNQCDLKKSIAAGHQLAYELHLFPANQIPELLVSFDKEHLRQLFCFGTTLGIFLSELPEAHWDYFLNLLGEAHIDKLIDSASTFGQAVANIKDPAILDRFILMIGNEKIQKMAVDERELDTLLCHLLPSKVKSFLKNTIGGDILNRIFFEGRESDFNAKKERAIAKAVNKIALLEDSKESKKIIFYIVTSSETIKKAVAKTLLALNIAENSDCPGDLPPRSNQLNQHPLSSQLGVFRAQPKKAEANRSQADIEREVRDYCKLLYQRQDEPRVSASGLSYFPNREEKDSSYVRVGDRCLNRKEFLKTLRDAFQANAMGSVKNLLEAYVEAGKPWPDLHMEERKAGPSPM